MPGDDKILSQHEIDALLSKNPSKARPKPPARATAAVKPPVMPKPKEVTPPVAPPKVTPLPPKEVIPPEKPPVEAAPPAPPPKAVAPPSPLPKAPPAGSATASYQNYTSDEVANLKQTIAELVRHVVKLTGAMQRIDRLEDKIEQITQVIKLNPDSTTVFERRIDELHRAIDEIRQNSVRDEFECSKCHTKQAVAVHVKCTTCGNENWMGWWPEAEHKEPEKTENPENPNP
ncbi:MAG: hypothetical protein ACYDG5_09535 [Dehalococcoidales bacterium]